MPVATFKPPFALAWLTACKPSNTLCTGCKWAAVKVWLADCQPPAAAGVDHAFVSVGGWVEQGAPAWSVWLVEYVAA